MENRPKIDISKKKKNTITQKVKCKKSTMLRVEILGWRRG
jgi:hypothetical protein